jgi:anti-sigma B factor antagonist
MPTSASRVHVQEVGDVTIVKFRGPRIIDEPNIQKIGEELFRLVDVLDRRNILIDFSNINYLSSAAIGKLLTLNKKLQAVGGKLVLCNLDPNVREVLVVARVRAMEVRDWNPVDDPGAELGGVWKRSQDAESIQD